MKSEEEIKSKIKSIEDSLIIGREMIKDNPENIYLYRHVDILSKQLKQLKWIVS